MYPFAVKLGSTANPSNPRSPYWLTFALILMKGVGRSVPFLKMRTTPDFCQIKSLPSGAKATPTGVKGGRVVTVSAKKPGSEKEICARAGGMRKRKKVMTGQRNETIHCLCRGACQPSIPLLLLAEMSGTAPFVPPYPQREQKDTVSLISCRCASRDRPHPAISSNNRHLTMLLKFVKVI